MVRQHTSDNRVAGNAIASVIQMVVSAILVFVLYRYINMTLGVDRLGVWSVIVATVSTTRLADLGLGAAVTRFVARDRARKEFDRAAQVVDTTTITLAVCIGVGLAPLYIIVANLIPHLFDDTYRAEATALLPLALGSLWLILLSAIFQSGLDGCQRMGLRATLVTLGQLLLLLLALWLVPKYGLVGLAYAQIGQGLFLLLSGRILLKHVMPSLTLLPWRWKKFVLREMLGYGVNLQVTSVMMLLVDPITKALLARFGNVTVVGYFEIASQVALRVRALIVGANQAIVPHISTLMELDVTAISRVYLENMRILILVIFPILALVVIASPIISSLILGHNSAPLTLMICVISITWSLNTLNVPAYFTNLGTGDVKWNTLSHTLTGVLNVLLGWVLGAKFQSPGILLAYIISIMVGSWVLILIHHARHGITWRAIGISRYCRLLATCLLSALIGFLAINLNIGIPSVFTIVVAAISILAVLMAVWANPTRRRVWELLHDGA